MQVSWRSGAQASRCAGIRRARVAVVRSPAEKLSYPRDEVAAVCGRGSRAAHPITRYALIVRFSCNEEAIVASRLNPYLNFAGNAREAMEFYRDVLGGELRMTTFGEFGSKEPEIADKIMHAMLETDAGYALMASDLPPGMEHRPGHNVVVSISGDDADAMRRYWEKL